MENFEKVITWMDWVTIIFSFCIMIISFLNWFNSKKELDKIPIYFGEKRLNLDIARKDFSRQEIQGILGVLRKDMKINYNISYLSEIEYLDNIYKIQTNKLDKLVIKIEPEELEQFKDNIYDEELL